MGEEPAERAPSSFPEEDRVEWLRVGVGCTQSAYVRTQSAYSLPPSYTQARSARQAGTAQASIALCIAWMPGGAASAGFPGCLGDLMFLC